jgi:EAL domain-containing protein (putative c-di-GMP-specific phosphodiesterase class I)
VTQALIDFELPPDQLVLEITESVVISSPAAIDRLNVLAAAGITLAIDDFGTGYSALTTLRSLPVRIVKIDKSFVAGSTLNSEDRAVTEAVVKRATQMGLQTIAEGVERLDQQAFLDSIGADCAQGFFYARPTTAQDFGTWLDGHLADSPTDPIHDGLIVVPFAARRRG